MKQVNQILPLCSIYFYLIIYLQAEQGLTTVTCNVPSVVKHAFAQLSCKFPSDFQLTESVHLSVNYNEKTDSGVNTEVLAYCLVRRQQQQCSANVHYVHPAVGYNETTKTASLSFNATSDREGDYYCQTIPSTDSKLCQFSLLSESDTTTTENPVTTPVPPPPPEVIIGIVIGVLAGIGIGIGIYFKRKSICRSCKYNGTLSTAYLLSDASNSCKDTLNNEIADTPKKAGLEVNELIPLVKHIDEGTNREDEKSSMNNSPRSCIDQGAISTSADSPKEAGLEAKELMPLVKHIDEGTNPEDEKSSMNNSPRSRKDQGAISTSADSPKEAEREVEESMPHDKPTDDGTNPEDEKSLRKNSPRQVKKDQKENVEEEKNS